MKMRPKHKRVPLATPNSLLLTMQALSPDTVRFKDAKVGQKVTRVLGWTIPIAAKVVEITAEKIITNGEAEFDRNTGIELIPFHGIPVSQLL